MGFCRLSLSLAKQRISSSSLRHRDDVDFGRMEECSLEHLSLLAFKKGAKHKLSSPSSAPLLRSFLSKGGGGEKEEREASRSFSLPIGRLAKAGLGKNSGRHFKNKKTLTKNGADTKKLLSNKQADCENSSIEFNRRFQDVFKGPIYSIAAAARNNHLTQILNQSRPSSLFYCFIVLDSRLSPLTSNRRLFQPRYGDAAAAILEAKAMRPFLR